MVSIDKTTDSEGRHATVMIVGTLNNTDFIPPFLLNLEYLDKVNSETISRFFLSTLC